MTTPVFRNKDDVVLEDEGEGALLLQGMGASQGRIWDIKDTTLADGHAPKRHLRWELEAQGMDLGAGFIMQETPVLVQRDQTGAIARTTPLNEIPGVNYTPRGIAIDQPHEEQEASITPTPLGRSERRKLVFVLAKRLYDYYAMPGMMASPKYNPIRDGIPDLPSGSSEHLKPMPGTPLYPATYSQVMAWLTKFVGDRATVHNKNQFGKDNLEDLALRIE